MSYDSLALITLIRPIYLMSNEYKILEHLNDHLTKMYILFSAQSWMIIPDKKGSQKTCGIVELHTALRWMGNYLSSLRNNECLINY